MSFSCWRYHEGTKGKVRITNGYGAVSVAGETGVDSHGAGMAWGSRSPHGQLRDSLNYIESAAFWQYSFKIPLYSL